MRSGIPGGLGDGESTACCKRDLSVGIEEE